MDPDSLQYQETDLSGEWQVRLDSGFEGKDKNWYKEDFSGEKIYLPGSLNAQKMGSKNTVKENFKLTNEYIYSGWAWYQKKFNISPEKNKRIYLFLERVHIVSRVWINGSYAGSCNSISTPHRFDITDFVKDGENCITIMVNNDFEIKLFNSHSYTDETQTNWNGIAGKICIRHIPVSTLYKTRVRYDSGSDEVIYDICILSSDYKNKNIFLDGFAEGENSSKAMAIHKKEIFLPDEKSFFEFRVKRDKNFLPWSDSEPNLYDFYFELSDENGQIIDTRKINTGFCHTGKTKDKFLINGKTVFLRGVVESAVFPLTGYPSSELSVWEDIMGKLKEYGFNHIRFHSWCPPEAAFRAASRLGIIIQAESPLWVGKSQFEKHENFREYIKTESLRITEEFMEFPAFAMFSLGNECGDHEGNMHPMLDDIISCCREKDPFRLYNNTTIPWLYHESPASDYYVAAVTKKGYIRSQGRFIISDDTTLSTRFDFSHSMGGINKPVIVHELGQWNMYPDIKEKEKYTGALKGYNFDLYIRTLEKSNLKDMSEKFRTSSGQFLARLQKEEIEAVMRTKELAGYHLLGIQDYPGFGTATLGMFDLFWDNKGIIEGDDYRNFCNETVILALFDKKVYTCSETFTADFKIANYGKSDLKGKTLKIMINSETGKTILEKKSEIFSEAGSLSLVADVSLELNEIKGFGEYTLSAELEETGIKNTWELWIFEEEKLAAQTKITDTWDDETEKILSEGGTVWIDASGYENDYIKRNRFVSVFWSMPFAWAQEGTLGIYTEYSHHAFSEFPTKNYSNWQWHPLLEKSGAIVLDNPGWENLDPLIYVIDNPNTNRKMGAMVQFRTGKGKVILTGMNLSKKDDPCVKRMINSISEYIESEYFDPRTKIEIDFLREVFRENRKDENASQGGAFKPLIVENND